MQRQKPQSDFRHGISCFPRLAPGIAGWAERVFFRQAALLILFSLLMSSAFAEAAAKTQLFDVPAGDAVNTLRKFSQQSGEQILYPIDQVRGVKTRAVKGSYTARAALETMLHRTELSVVQDQTSGAFVIKRARDKDQIVSANERPARRLADAEVVRDIVTLSPFEVLSRADAGYQATNAVSATRMAMPIGDLPMTVNTFTEDFISDQKAYDLYDVVKWAPGVHQDNLSPQGWVRYTIRGFNSAAVQRNGFGSFRFIDTTNVARIEVVKGPASLLYGQINPGGVINYITKRPTEAAAVRLNTAMGDRHYKRAEVDATGPAPGTAGRLLYRGIAMAEEIQRFQAHARGKKFLLAPSATWKLSDRIALTVEFEHFERLEEMLTSGVVMVFRDGMATAPYSGLPWDFNYAGEGDYQDFVSDAFIAELTAQLGEHVGVKATYLDSYWDMEWRATGQGGTGLLAQSFIDHYYPASAGLTSRDAMYRRNRWEHHWGGERTGQIDTVGTFQWRGVDFRALIGGRRTTSSRIRILQKINPNVAGHPLYLKPWDLRDSATWDRAVPFGIDALIPAANLQGSSHSSSVYGVGSASAFDDRLLVLAGYARHRIHNHSTLNLIAGTGTDPASRAASVPQAGALFKLRPEISAFASYSESFVANTSMLRVNNVFTTPAAPTRGRGHELGFKLELQDGKISGTISAYQVRASPTGIITFTSGVDSSGATLFTDVQGGTQLSEGFELDLLLKPVPELQLLAAFGRCDAVYERHPTNAALNGSPLVATPDRTFSLWAKYDPSRGPLARLSLSGGVNYVGSFTFVGSTLSARADPYTTIDVSAGYRFRTFNHEWAAEFSVKNVTNEHYYPSSSSWGFPRHAIVSLRTKF